MIKHDEKKIEGLLNTNWHNDNPLSQMSSMKQYAEHMVQQDRDRIVAGLEKEYKGQVSQVQDAIDFINLINK